MTGRPEKRAQAETSTQASDKQLKTCLPVITLHEAADLTLIIGPEKQTVKVLRSAMQTTSSSWRAMFKPEWTESTSSSIEFPEDDATAMLLVLHIAHHKYEDLPRSLEWKDLLQLVVVCDKYDLIHIVRHFMVSRKWLEPYRSSIFNPKYTGWLFVAYSLGEINTFKSLAEHIFLNSHQKGAWLAINDRLIECIGYKVVIEDIEKSRDATISKLREICQNVFQQVQETRLCKAVGADEWEQKRCRATIVGFVLCRERDVGLLQIGTMTRRYRTLKTAGDELRKFYDMAIRGNSSHRECAKFADISEKVAEVMDNLPELVTDVQRVHMEIQAKKWVA